MMLVCLHKKIAFSHYPKYPWENIYGKKCSEPSVTFFRLLKLVTSHLKKLGARKEKKVVSEWCSIHPSVSLFHQHLEIKLIREKIYILWMVGWIILYRIVLNGISQQAWLSTMTFFEDRISVGMLPWVSRRNLFFTFRLEKVQHSLVWIFYWAFTL